MTKNEAIILNLLGDVQRVRRDLKFMVENLSKAFGKLLDKNDMLRAKVESLELELVAEGDINPYGDTITVDEIKECLGDNHAWTPGVFINKPCICGKMGYAMESLSGGIDVEELS